MQVFCFELVSTGYFSDRIADSFVQEGNAMLHAVTCDFCRIPGVSVSTIVAAGSSARSELSGCTIVEFSPGDSLERWIGSLAGQADATLMIAPEFDHLLEQVCHTAAGSRSLLLNCDAVTVRLGADKWNWARHLSECGLPTIATEQRSVSEPPSRYPCVVKPRFGAGSWLVRRLNCLDEWPAVAEEYRHAGLDQLLVQPWIPGRALSIAAMRHRSGRAEILPVAEQDLSKDGSFGYRGGFMPARIDSAIGQEVRRVAERTLSELPGWSGYVGFDILISDENPAVPLIVELNPRLTTSYLGYRRLCRDNLMERLLFPGRFSSPLSWRSEPLAFTPHDGFG